MKRRAALIALCLLPPAAHDAPGADLLPEVSVRLKAARYMPAERDLGWTGWIGAGAGLLRVGTLTAYGTAEVETILGSALRAFDANQANYHLELGLRRPVGTWELAPFFHHVSRHSVDRPKTRAVDWNVLGLRVSTGKVVSALPVRFVLSVGHTTQASLPSYEWEVVGLAEAEVLRGGWGEAYVRGEARLVTANPTEALPRDDFLDLTFEGGGRFRRGAPTLEAFLAFERRNDVFPEAPGSRDRALLGIRILYVGR